MVESCNLSRLLRSFSLIEVDLFELLERGHDARDSSLHATKGKHAEGKVGNLILKSILNVINVRKLIEDRNRHSAFLQRRDSSLKLRERLRDLDLWQSRQSSSFEDEGGFEGVRFDEEYMHGSNH